MDVDTFLLPTSVECCFTVVKKENGLHEFKTRWNVPSHVQAIADCFNEAYKSILIQCWCVWKLFKCFP